MNSIRFITSFTHGFVDYAGALVLLITPIIANFQETSDLAYWLSVGAGLTLLFYSLLTDYTLSVKSMISLKWHLILDAIASVVFLTVPFVAGFGGFVKLFFLANGMLVMLAVLLTDSRSASIQSPSLDNVSL